MQSALTTLLPLSRDGEKVTATVLVVDDERVNRTVISRLLQRQFKVVEAADGLSAIACVEAGGIDIVVVDIHMSGMDGYETTRRLKEIAGGSFLPCILMTATNDESLFAHGLLNGADDFLAKPITRSILEAKIEALLRVAAVFRAINEQNQELNLWRERAEQDFAVAQRVFQHIADRGCMDFPGLEVRGLSLEAFNGDIVLAESSGNGRLRILVGDFAGHGLGAALGALPVSDVFYAMTRQRFPIESLVREIGDKLHRLFPRNLFLAACIAEVDTRHQSVKVWNGGLPDTLVLDAGGQICGRIPSGHPALGVLPTREIVPRVTELPFPLGSRLLMYSDGLIEARSAAGECFGEERLERQLASAASTDWFSSLWEAFQAFRLGTPQDDDVTVLGVCHTPELREALLKKLPKSATPDGECEISIQLSFHASALRDPDPLAPLRILFESSPALALQAPELYTIAAELFSNALEHGILRLDSRIKQQPDGFEEYYRRREESLRDLTAGQVTVEFRTNPIPGQRSAILRVSDDGPGVPEDILKAAREPQSRSGRGLQLVSELGASIRFADGGRTVEATLPLAED